MSYCRGCHSVRAAVLSAFDSLLTKVAGMQNFTALKEFTLRGQAVAIGQTVQLSPLDATQCINLGLVEPVAPQQSGAEPSGVILDEFAFIAPQADQPTPDAAHKKRR